MSLVIQWRRLDDVWPERLRIGDTPFPCVAIGREGVVVASCADGSSSQAQPVSHSLNLRTWTVSSARLCFPRAYECCILNVGCEGAFLETQDPLRFVVRCNGLAEQVASDARCLKWRIVAANARWAVASCLSVPPATPPRTKWSWFSRMRRADCMDFRPGTVTIVFPKRRVALDGVACLQAHPRTLR